MTVATAPHAAGWAGRFRNLPGPFPEAGSPPAGVPFLQNVLTDPTARIVVEAAFGADPTTDPNTWNFYDITGDVRQAGGQRVAVSPMGRSDETSLAQPAGCGFQLDNTRADYSAYNPASRWFPFVRRNTPIRVRLYIGGIWSTRFQGYANGFVPSWDSTANMAVVTVSASGVTRRLIQGKTPLRSALYRAISLSGPSFYWPMEDGSLSTRAASGLIGGAPLAVLGTTPKFAGAAGPAGSANVIDFSAGGELRTYLAAPAVAPAGIRGECVFKFTSPPGFADPIISWDSQGGTIAYTQAFCGSGPGHLFVGFFSTTYSGGGPGGNFDTGVSVGDGLWHHLRLEEVTSGADVVFTATLDGVVVYNSTLTVETLGSAALLYVARGNNINPAPMSIGHVAIWQPYNPPTTVDTYQAFLGYVGESPTTRIARLCAEQAMPLAMAGTSNQAMGPQSVDTFLNLLRECEATDHGVLGDGLGPGLRYTARSARYNMTPGMTPDMAADPPQVDDPFQPADDDQRNRNLYKVDRRNGSNATVQDTVGTLGINNIGVYDSTATINTQTDDVLPAHAAWFVRLGVVEGFRYPTLNLDLAATPGLIPAWIATGDNDRVDVLNVVSKATQHPPYDVPLLVEGYSESFDPFSWQVQANCSPYLPWRVPVIEDIADTVWRIDSGASTLQTAVPAGVTSLSVVVADGQFWSTAVGDYPRDLNIGGVKVTATAVATAVGTSQIFTVNTTPYPLYGGASVTLWRSPSLAL